LSLSLLPLPPLLNALDQMNQDDQRKHKTDQQGVVEIVPVAVGFEKSQQMA
jgi:hypothetical protein